MKRFAVFTLSLVLLPCLSLAQSSEERVDRLLIERTRQAESANLPSRGMRMADVEARFGAPQQKRTPVGGDRPQHPPITRWVYPAFSVYFEHDRVVSAVLNRASERERGPKPVQ